MNELRIWLFFGVWLCPNQIIVTKTCNSTVYLFLQDKIARQGEWLQHSGSAQNSQSRDHGLESFQDIDIDQNRRGNTQLFPLLFLSISVSSMYLNRFLEKVQLNCFFS